MKEKALEICRNIQHTLDKQNLSETCTKYLNPMFDKPKVRKGILKKQQEQLMKKYNIKKEEI